MYTQYGIQEIVIQGETLKLYVVSDVIVITLSLDQDMGRTKYDMNPETFWTIPCIPYCVWLRNIGMHMPYELIEKHLGALPLHIPEIREVEGSRTLL